MNENNKPRLNCDIVGDLLPLYHDEVISDSGREAVTEHLAVCTRCKKEYEGLCKEMSTEHETSATQEKFQAMMRRLKWKRIGITVLAVLLSCGILGGGYGVLTRIPLKEYSAEEVQILRAYRYTGEDGVERLFFICEMPFGDYTQIRFHPDSNDPKTMELTVKIPLLGARHPELGTHLAMECWDLPEGITQAEFRDAAFWTEAENGDDHIPEYVYAYDSFMRGDGGITAWGEVQEGGYLIAQYEDDTRVCWDLDGNVYETVPAVLDANEKMENE